MNQTQSIIVYRNPMEQAMWENLMGFENMIPVCAGFLVMVLMIAAFSNIFSHRYGYRWPNWTSYVMWGTSIATGIQVIRFMWV